jgi:hypothetical protein
MAGSNYEGGGGWRGAVVESVKASAITSWPNLYLFRLGMCIKLIKLYFLRRELARKPGFIYIQFLWLVD